MNLGLYYHKQTINLNLTMDNHTANHITAYHKICSVIEFSVLDEQFEVARRMIDQYKLFYPAQERDIVNLEVILEMRIQKFQMI